MSWRPVNCGMLFSFTLSEDLILGKNVGAFGFSCLGFWLRVVFNDRVGLSLFACGANGGPLCTIRDDLERGITFADRIGNKIFGFLEYDRYFTNTVFE